MLLCSHSVIHVSVQSLMVFFSLVGLKKKNLTLAKSTTQSHLEDRVRETPDIFITLADSFMATLKLNPM